MEDVTRLLLALLPSIVIRLDKRTSEVNAASLAGRPVIMHDRAAQTR